MLELAKRFRCAACEECRKPEARHVITRCDARPGKYWKLIASIDHPVSGTHAQGLFMFDVGSKCPIFEESPQREGRNNTTDGCDTALLGRWMQHWERPKVRLDPDGAYMSNRRLDMLQALQLDVQVTPPETP